MADAEGPSVWQGPLRWLVWLAVLGSTLLLGVLHQVTGAEYALASLAILPVLVVSWLYGSRAGLILSALAAVTGLSGEVAYSHTNSQAWIPWVNTVMRWLTYSLIAVLVAQVRLQMERLRRHATHDELTDLLNRRALLAAGEAEAVRAERYGRPLTTVFLDLDNFKLLNDTRGHEAGDGALQATAAALKRSLRASDHVARLGGDEFAILMPEIDFDAALAAGQKIKTELQLALQDFRPVTASVGVAWFEQARPPFAGMLQAADALMYEVKQTGKGEVAARRFSAAEAAAERPATKLANRA